jgi:hypothetical protein
VIGEQLLLTVVPITPAEPKVNVSDLVWACVRVPVEMPTNSRVRTKSLFIAEPLRTMVVAEQKIARKLKIGDPGLWLSS